MRGQAFIVFKDITSATNALKEMNGFEFIGRPMKAKKQDTKKSTPKPKSSTPASAPATGTPQPREAPPNKVLFIENLPEKCEEMMLQMLFSQFQGFQSVSMTTARKGIAFIEFDDEIKSGIALSHLQGFKVTPEKPMVISFANQ
eukprot:gene9732-11366_t